MRAGVTPHDDAGLAGPEVLGERRGSRDLGDADPPIQLLGKGREQVAVPAEQVLSRGDVVQHRAADDGAVLPDWMAAEREGGDHTEVAAATAQRPEQITVRLFAGGDETAVGQHHIGGDQIVDGEAETARQVADPTAQSQPTNPGRGHKTRRQRQSKRPGGMVHITPDTTAVDPHRTRLRIDGGAAEAAEVDDQGVIPNPEPAAVMCAAADRDR